MSRWLPRDEFLAKIRFENSKKNNGLDWDDLDSDQQRDEIDDINESEE